MKITLSLWDTAGQERFGFLKTDFFKGVAAVGVVFDLSRPDTFDKIDAFLKDIREYSGNIPIILVGNKNDLKKELGEVIPREKIIKKVNQYNLFEYIETSALEKRNINQLFYRLVITALLDFRARLGEVVDSNHLRFKILLAGDAAVGKSSLIKAFITKEFEEDYKLTVGLDLLTQDVEISEEDIPKETHELIGKLYKSYKKKFKRYQRKDDVIQLIPNPDEFNAQSKPIDDNNQNDQKLGNPHKKRKFLLITISILIPIIVLFMVYLLFFR